MSLPSHRKERNPVSVANTLLLVSAAHPFLTAPPDDLVPATAGASVLLRREAAEQLQRALAHIAAGSSILPIDGFRSRPAQAQLYATSLAENGVAFTQKFVAPPGASEHETDLAIDLALNRPPLDPICPDFPNDGICARFRKIAPRFGFIERYPAGKEQITGIAHEPWHFRYVGTPHARLMTASNLCLEEYLDWIRRYSAEQPLIFGQNHQPDHLLFYLPMGTSWTPPRHYSFRLFAHDSDGFIVVLWKGGQSPGDTP